MFVERLPAKSYAVLVFGLVAMQGGFAQSASDKGVKLAWDNKCSEAMPLLDQGMRDAAVQDESRRAIAYAGVMCSMSLNQQMDAMSFLAWLQQHYAQDPDVLFLAVNVFSELSDRNAKNLLQVAPQSAQVIQLNAQNFERHGDFARAIEEYKILLQREPDKVGIHYRLGGLYLENQEKTGYLDNARNEFLAELKLNPQAAGAEYYLGEMDRQADRLPEAIKRFSRAVELQPDFADAYLGLGRALLDLGRKQDAVDPLEKGIKLAPSNPNFHFALANAYQRLGRKQDADREYALQKSLAKALNDNSKNIQKNVNGANSPKAK